MGFQRQISFLKVLVLLVAFIMPGCKSSKNRQSASVSSKAPSAKHKGSAAVSKSNSGALELKKIGISNSELHENKLYQFIQDWYGTTYKYGGCQKSGVDCSCFANILFEQVYNKKIPRSSNDIFASCDKISLEEAREGDLLFFKISGKDISHIGVYLRKNYFIHSSTSKGVVINTMEEAYYKKYFFCAGKMKNV